MDQIQGSNLGLGNAKTVSLHESISELHNLIEEIKSHVLESKPMTENDIKNPQSDHKLININSAIVNLKYGLQEILHAVTCI